jgi:peptidoglycan/xylan/chitin deacetylase (PgdA/CDA1 family)
MGIRFFFNEISLPVSKILPLSKLVGFTQQNRILPFYHSVSDKPLPHLKHVLHIRNVKTFEADLDFYIKHFKPVDALELWQDIREGSPHLQPSFHLSFDDGLKECISVIAPILKSRGIPATFFINTGFIGNRDIFYRFKASLLIEKTISVTDAVLKEIHSLLDKFSVPAGDLKKRILSVTCSQKDVLDEAVNAAGLDFREYAQNQEIYMNVEDIRQMLEQGFTVGAHSIDHPLFSEVTLDEQLRQTNQSIEYIRNKFGVSPSLFSFPFTDDEVSAEFFRRIYIPEGNLDLTFGISGLKNDMYPSHLQRIPMEAGTYSAKQIITGEYLYFMAKSIFRKNKINRK